MKGNSRRSWRRMLIAIVTIVVVLGVLTGALVAGMMVLEKHEFAERTEVLKSTSSEPKRALVVYQPSLSPASYDVAKAIARGLNDAGFEVKISNPGRHLSADISAYEAIVLGSPNYGNSVAAALRNYVQMVESYSGKRVLLFSTSGAGGDKMVELEQLAQLLPDVKEPQTFKFQFRETEKNKATAYQLGKDMATK